MSNDAQKIKSKQMTPFTVNADNAPEIEEQPSVTLKYGDATREVSNTTGAKLAQDIAAFAKHVGFTGKVTVRDENGDVVEDINDDFEGQTLTIEDYNSAA